MTKKIKPDYNCGCSVSGSAREEAKIAAKVYGAWSGEWPRWFDDGRRKRKVVVVIDTFFGDYHHWYVELEEEEDPYWLPPCEEHKNGIWVHDNLSHGQKFDEKFNTKQGAEAYTNIILRDHFPDHRPVVGRHNFGSTNRTWNYSREGD